MSAVSLNEGQLGLVDMAMGAARRPGKVVVGAGAAGTGKTTTLRRLKELLGADQFVLAPTGRAARRAAQVTRMEASTIHRWLYRPAHEDDDSVAFVRCPPSEVARPRSGLLIVDECSMLGRDICDDILATAIEIDCSVLFVGDSFQLPPVVGKDEPAFSVFDDGFENDGRVTLTEVWRQALESPILRAATKLRQSTLAEARTILARELPWLQESIADCGAAAQRNKSDAVIIAHRNETRLGLNRAIRGRMGIDPGAEPQAGEPLLVRRNSQDVGVFNGEILPFSGWLEQPFAFAGETLGRTVFNRVRCAMSPDAILGLQSDPRRHVLRRLSEDRGLPYVRAQLGYAITCHASQGSEWDRVVVVVESSLAVMPEEERIRWLYTAITRAKTEVVLAREPVFSRPRRQEMRVT